MAGNFAANVFPFNDILAVCQGELDGSMAYHRIYVITFLEL